MHDALPALPEMPFLNCPSIAPFLNCLYKIPFRTMPFFKMPFLKMAFLMMPFLKNLFTKMPMLFTRWNHDYFMSLMAYLWLWLNARSLTEPQWKPARHAASSPRPRPPHLMSGDLVILHPHWPCRKNNKRKPEVKGQHALRTLKIAVTSQPPSGIHS